LLEQVQGAVDRLKMQFGDHSKGRVWTGFRAYGNINAQGAVFLNSSRRQLWAYAATSRLRANCS
jgi:hypothetical protein